MSLLVKNTNNGMIETNYGAGNRYGLGQFTNGILALYTADTYAPSSIAFGRMTSTSTFVDLLHIDHGGNVGIGTMSPGTKLSLPSGEIGIGHRRFRQRELGIQRVVVSGEHETAAHGHLGSAEVAETGLKSPDSLI